MINLAYRNRMKYGHLAPKRWKIFFMPVAIPWNKIRIQLRKQEKVDIGKYLADSAIPTKITWVTANFKM